MRSRCAILTVLVLGLMLAAPLALAAPKGDTFRGGVQIHYSGDLKGFSLREAALDALTRASSSYTNIVVSVSPKSGEVTAVFAQGDSEDSETQGETEGGEGQSGEEAETGSEEADTGEAATETGPPWTFQMARISLVLTLLLGLAIARWYYKLVASRQKGAA